MIKKYILEGISVSKFYMLTNYSKIGLIFAHIDMKAFNKKKLQRQA